MVHEWCAGGVKLYINKNCLVRVKLNPVNWHQVLTHPIFLATAPAVITGILSFDLGRTSRYFDSKLQCDRDNYKRLEIELPSFEKIKLFFKEKSLTDSFNTDAFDEFRRAFQLVKEDPGRNFLDSKIQKQVQTIFELCEAMDHIIGIETFPVPNGDQQSIRRKKYNFSYDDMETGHNPRRPPETSQSWLVLTRPRLAGFGWPPGV